MEETENKELNVETIEEDDIPVPSGGGLIEDEKIQNDLKEAIIGIESVLEINHDVPENNIAEREGTLKRQGSIKFSKDSKTDDCLPSHHTFHISRVEEDGGDAMKTSIPKAKFQFDSTGVEPSKYSSPRDLASTMSNILITYQVELLIQYS